MLGAEGAAEARTEALPQPAPDAVSRPLRSRLFMLAASGLVPLALGLIFAAAYLADVRRADTERSALDLSRALASAIDSELRSTISLLQNLAIATDLQDTEPGEFGGSAFAHQARRITRSQGWEVLTVVDSSGQLLFRSREGPVISRPVEPASVAKAIETGAPVVGPVARGPGGDEAFAIRVPVYRDSQLRYVLSAAVPSARIFDLVARQQVAPSWVVGVFDASGNRIARSRPTGATRYSATLEELVRRNGREGHGVTRTLEGVDSHSGFARVPTSQWVVAIAIPVSEANADVYRLLGALGAGTLASLALLAWLAFRAAAAISGPINELKAAAAQLGAGRAVHLPPLGVSELDEVGAALQRAARDLDDANARRARVEGERERLLARVEEALTAAEQANRNKDEFLALLGHELRNPLAPITNALHLMDLKDDPGTARERGVIHRQLSYVTRLVDDLLDAARINSKRLVMNLQPVQPVRVLEQTLEAVRPSLGARALRVEIDPNARGLWVKADEARLVQIFNNLIGNAIKFTSPEGTITAGARLDDGYVQLWIADDGVGMTQEEIARAFDIFYQAPGSVRTRGVHGGLGLGLAIVKSLVDMHAGKVGAQSNGPGTGTRITICLPPVDGGHEHVRAAATHSHAHARVLVCDDNEDAATTLAALLAASGYEAREVFDPQAAIAAFDSFRPAVAFLDIGLPGMDGYELAMRLREMPGGDACKFVALTGYGQEADVKKAFAASFDAHLTKPADPDVMLRLLAGFFPA